MTQEEIREKYIKICLAYSNLLCSIEEIVYNIDEDSELYRHLHPFFTRALDDSMRLQGVEIPFASEDKKK